MKPRFDGDQPIGYGFDGDCMPPFQLIPHNDFRASWLYDADGMDVRSIVPGVVRIEEISSSVKNLRFFKFHGIMVGKTFIEVRNNARLMTRLEVLVAAPLSFTISFNFVSDSENSVIIHKTKRSKSEIENLMFTTNNVIMNQTNIKMIQHNVRDLIINKNLGEEINYPNDWFTISNKGDKSAVLNVYFVWRLNSAGLNLDRTIMIQDELYGVPTENVLGHEIGHFLGMPDENREEKADGFLMSSGSKVRRNEILVMRKMLSHILKLSRK